jgi:NodT family efflux transporter outer membrane factor (OMF) lipoprotein
VKLALLLPAVCAGGRVIAMTLAVSTLGACAMGPDYERPTSSVAQTYKELADWKVAEPRDGEERGPWWTAFDDPVLDALVQRVEVSNQTLAANEAAFRQARAVVEQTRSQLYPTLSANASVRRTGRGSGSGSGGFGNFSGTGTDTLLDGNTNAVAFSSAGVSNNPQTRYQPSLTASWDLDVWGRIRRTIESDVASAQASAADLAAAKLSAQAELATDYFQLRAADEQKQLLEYSAAAYERSLRITQNQYQWGIATRGDVAQAETQLESTRAQAIGVSIQRAQFEHAIAVLAGMPPADLSIAPAELGLVPPPVPAGLPSVLLERRPDVAAAERRVAAASAQIGVAEAAYFPDITLTSSVGYATTALGSLFDSSNFAWSLGVALAETVFDAGSRSAVVAQARAGYDQAIANYRQTALASFQDVEDQLASLRILEQQAAVQERAVAAAREAERLQLNQYKAGTVDYTSVVTAQQAALSNEQTALTIRQNRFASTVALIRALGGGWSDEEIPDQVGRTLPRLY